MKTSSLVSSLLLALTPVLADQFRVKLSIEETDYFFKVNEGDDNIQLYADEFDVFELTGENYLRISGDAANAISSTGEDPFLKKIEIGGAHTPNTWLLDDNVLTYDSQLYYCGDAPPFHITTDASTYPGNEGGDICNEIVSFETVPYQEPPPENTVDPAEPMEVKGKLGEDDVTLSTNGEYVTVGGEDTALFTIDDDGYLKVGEDKWVKVDSGALALVDAREEGTDGWSLVGDQLKLDDDFVVYTACEVDDVKIVHVDASGCDEVTEIVIENYEEPPPENTVDPAEPMEVKGKLGEDDVTLSTNGQYVIVGGEDTALFTIDEDGYLKVGEDKWVKVDSGALALVDAREEGTDGWSLVGDQLKLGDDFVVYTACEVDDVKIVHVDASGCDEIIDIVIENYEEPPPENTVDPAEPMEIKGKLGEDDVTLSTNGEYVTVGGEDTALFTIDEDGYLKVGEDKWVKVDSGALALVDAREEGTDGWSLVGDQLKLGDDFVVYTACEVDDVKIVHVDASGCDEITEIVIENYEEPPPPVNTVDPSEPMNVTVIFNDEEIYFRTDGNFITLNEEDVVASFIIDEDGYLKVGEDKWVKVLPAELLDVAPEQGQLVLVSNREEGTQGWRLLNDLFILDEDEVLFATCLDDDGNQIVYVNQEMCTALESVLVQNIEDEEDDPTSTEDEPTETGDESTTEDEPTETGDETSTIEEPTDSDTDTGTGTATIAPGSDSETSTTSIAEDPTESETETGTGTVAPGSDSETSTITATTTVPSVITTTECDSDSSCSVITTTIEPVFTTITETDCDSLSSCSVVTRTVEVILTTVTDEVIVTITDCDEETTCVTKETICTTIYTTYCPVPVTTTEVETCITDLTITITTCDEESICEEYTTVVEDTEVTTTLTTYYVITKFISGVEQVVTVPVVETEGPAGPRVGPSGDKPEVPAVPADAENIANSVKSASIGAIITALVLLFPMMMM